MHDAALVDYPIRSHLHDFDPQSSSFIERLIFNHRPIVLFICLLAAAVLGARATRLTLNASFENMLPMGHPYIVNYVDAFTFRNEFAKRVSNNHSFTWKVVMLTGLTLAIATGIWAFSPIKFQADMGILLAFMFLWNLLAMLLLLPVLSVFLLQKEGKFFQTFGRAK